MSFVKCIVWPFIEEKNLNKQSNPSTPVQPNITLPTTTASAGTPSSVTSTIIVPPPPSPTSPYIPAQQSVTPHTPNSPYSPNQSFVTPQSPTVTTPVSTPVTQSITETPKKSHSGPSKRTRSKTGTVSKTVRRVSGKFLPRWQSWD